MTDSRAFDVVIAGGGMAGAAVAAAPAGLGLRVLALQPGLDASQRPPGALVPPPGFGSIIVGGRAPALASQIARHGARGLSAVPGRPEGSDAVARGRAPPAALPEPMRAAVGVSMNARRGLVSASYSVVPDTVV